MFRATCLASVAGGVSTQKLMPLTHGLKFVDHEQKPGKIQNKQEKQQH